MILVSGLEEHIQAKPALFPVCIYLLKVNNRNTQTRSEICSKLKIKTPERRHWDHFDVFLVNFEHISHFVLVDFQQLNVGWFISALQRQRSYSEPCQRSKTERFVKIITGLYPWTIFQKNPSQMFDRVLNTPLWLFVFCRKLFVDVIIKCFSALASIFRASNNNPASIYLFKVNNTRINNKLIIPD